MDDACCFAAAGWRVVKSLIRESRPELTASSRVDASNDGMRRRMEHALEGLELFSNSSAHRPVDIHDATLKIC